MRNKQGLEVPSAEYMRRTCFKDAHQLLIEERGTSDVGRTTYKYCKKHKEVEEVTSKCFHTEAQEVNAPVVQTFASYWDPSLGGRGGIPVYVTSKAMRKRLMKEHHLEEAG